MQQFSIKTKLWLLTIFSLIVVGLVGLTGWIGVAGIGGSLESVSARMEAVNTLMGIRTWQLTSVGETRGARGWDFATFDAIQDPKESLAEAHSFFGYVLKSKLEADARVQQFFDAYAKLPKAPDEAALWKQYQEEWVAYDEISQQINAQIREMSSASDWAMVRGKFTTLRNNDDSSLPLVLRTMATLDKLLELGNRYAAEERKSGNEQKATVSALIAAIVAGAILGLALMSWFIVRGVVGSLNSLRSAIIHVAESNDFTASVTVENRDEAGQIAQAFNTLLQNMQTSLREVLDSAERISAVARQAAEAAGNVSGSSTSQSEAASAMASTVEEMTVSIGHISESAREALSRARDSSTAADNGTQMIARSTGEMDAIARTVGQTGKTIDALGKHSDRISMITQVIKEVADQTNLLALNAAIEAARAGEQGRGFAVVADEVRKLAERTAHSAGEISEMIGDVLSSARSAVTGMESVTGMVAGGKNLSEQVADRMNVIRADTEQVTGSINEISLALNEQSTATQDIARQVEMVARMSEGNCSAAAETARISGELNTLAESLRTAANRFRV